MRTPAPSSATAGFTLTAMLLLFAMAEASAQPIPSFDHAALAKRALKQHIRPGYQRLAEAGKAFERAMSAACARPGSAPLPAVRSAFDAYVSAWGRIEHITFGPIATENRIERILFFPDRRGLAARQIATALKTGDPSVTEPASLAKKSVGLQGLAAFEIVMLGKPAPAEKAEARLHRCLFGQAIAANLAAIAEDVRSEWDRDDGFGKLWLSPGPGNPAFLKPAETTLALAKAVARGIEQVRDERIVAPLGFGPQRRKMPAVLSASGRTIRLVQANIEGIRDLWTKGGMETAIITGHTPKSIDSVPDIATLVGRELDTAGKLAAPLIAVPRPFDGAPATRTLISMGFPLKNARYHAMALLSDVAGVTLGFNSSDGD